MTLYNMLFGENPFADVLLGVLDLNKKDVGRFRNIYVNNQEEICVYTRNGGGNRQHWSYDLAKNKEGGDDCSCPGCIITHRLPKHPLYLRDEDDNFDNTYATIYFRIPDDLKEVLSRISEDQTPEEKWKTFIKKLKKE